VNKTNNKKIIYQNKKIQHFKPISNGYYSFYIQLPFPQTSIDLFHIRLLYLLVHINNISHINMKLCITINRASDSFTHHWVS